MATENNISALVVQKFFNAQKVLIMTHLRPDGDALGSTFGLRSFLRHNGVSAEVVLPSGMPARFNKLCPGALSGSEAVSAEFDLLVSLDCANIERLGMPDDLTQESLYQRGFISIDHHRMNSINAPVSVLDENAGSACEVLAGILKSSCRSFGSDTATLLMMGMMTDTGNFCFANTSAETFETAAELMRRGADVTAVANNVFFSKPIRQMRFEAEFVHLFEFACNERLAMAYVPQELMDKYEFKMSEDEGLIDLLRCIDGVIIAILLHKRPDGFRVSMRSKESRYPVGPFARANGGGGHDLAAGMTLDLPTIEEVREFLVSGIGKILQ